jgi:hypothetical protein
MDLNFILDELERERDEINAAIVGIRHVMSRVNGSAPISEAPRPPVAAAPPPAAEPVSHPIGPKAKRPYKRKGAERHCDKHPDNRKDFAPNGSCRPCTREYQRNRAAKLRAGTWNDDDAPAGTSDAPPEQDNHEAAPIAEEPVERNRPGRKPQACQKHPGAEKYASSGQCKECVREAGRKRRADPGPSIDEHIRDRVQELEHDARDSATEEPRAVVFSVKTRCPKCQNITRLSRPKDANLKTDSWACMMRGCLIRISHIVLSLDKNYQGAA